MPFAALHSAMMEALALAERLCLTEGDLRDTKRLNETLQRTGVQKLRKLYKISEGRPLDTTT